MHAPTRSRAPVAAIALLLACAVLGAVLVWLYPDAYQQDGGTHFLLARWGWKYPKDLVDVWGRPLFTTLYSLPAQFGYAAAKGLTVAIAVATAWQTWRYAEEEGLSRSALAIPFLWLQPSFLLLSDETMTEPMCALLLIIALRLKRADRQEAAALVMSGTILVRPEGPVLCAAWAVWLLFERSTWRSWSHRLGTILLLGTGLVLWWAAALLITNDMAFIEHDWPRNWTIATATYGHGFFLNYFYRRAEIIAPLLELPFAIGVIAAIVRRRLGLPLLLVVAFFVLHSLLWGLGAFGSAGYPRYFVCVSPAIALLILLGWATVFGGVRQFGGAAGRVIEIVATTVVLVLSLFTALTYVDGMPWTRDSRLVDRAYDYFRVNPRPVRAFAASQAYMHIRFGYDPKMSFLPQSEPEAAAMRDLRRAPAGSLVIWDADTGPAFFGGVTADSVIAAGFQPLAVFSDSLYGRFIPHLGRGGFFPHAAGWGWSEPRVQRVWVLYK